MALSELTVVHTTHKCYTGPVAYTGQIGCVHESKTESHTIHIPCLCLNRIRPIYFAVAKNEKWLLGRSDRGKCCPWNEKRAGFFSFLCLSHILRMVVLNACHAYTTDDTSLVCSGARGERRQKMQLLIEMLIWATVERRVYSCSILNLHDALNRS